MNKINVNYKIAEIGDDVIYKKDIIPTQEVELERPIIIGKRARVGNLYGKKIEIKAGEKENPTLALECFGIEEVKIGDFCKIEGIVQSLGKIYVGEEEGNCRISKDVIGKEIIISKNCKINGCVIAEEDLVIGKNSIINGYVVSLNKNVKIGSNSKIFDVIACEQIKIENNVCINDPIIWCGKSIKNERLKVGSVEGFEVFQKKEVKKENEVNPYYVIFDINEIFNFNKILKDLA